jgi:hypothetical protein
MEKLRIKCNVAEITNYGNAGGAKIILMPVIGESQDNAKLWENTPSGKIELHLTTDQPVFELGEYFVDFVKL